MGQGGESLCGGGGGDGRRRGKGWPAPAEHQTYNLEGLAPGLRKGIATRRGPMPVQEAKPNEDTKRIADEGNCMEVPEEGQEDTLVESAEAVLAEDVCRLAKGSVAYPNAAAEGNVELGTLFGEVNRRALDEVMVAEAEEPLLDRTHDLRGLRLRALEAKVEELGDIFGKALRCPVSWTPCQRFCAVVWHRRLTAWRASRLLLKL